MENKNVGMIIIGISIVIVFIVLIFNSALKKVVDATCTHGPSCSMFDTIRTQTYISLSIIAIILIIGLVIMFTKPKEKIIIKKVKEKKQNKKIDLKDFRPDEKEVFKFIQKEKTIFQADLIEKSKFGKAKITRILDKLEGNNLIERKRRGLTNIVILKE